MDWVGVNLYRLVIRRCLFGREESEDVRETAFREVCGVGGCYD